MAAGERETRMRIANLIAPRRFQIVEGAAAAPGPGEVQARVRSVGVCGSDLHNFSEGSVGDTPSVFPMVLGHEPAGVIARCGPGVTGWSEGDRVLLEPAVYCYHCEFCVRGRHNLCANLRFLSQPHDPGFFREYVNLPAANLLPLPAGLGFDQGTLFEPLAVALHSLKFAALRPGETAAVFGAGPIGLLTVAVLRLAGASRIWTVEPVARRRELALAVGADDALDASAVDPAREILGATGRRGVDVALDCATKGPSLDQCIHAARNGGRVVVTGIPSETRPRIDFHVMRRKELALFNVRRSNHESEAAVHLLAEYPGRFASILTHSRPMDEIEPSFTLLENYADGVGKLVIRP